MVLIQSLEVDTQTLGPARFVRRYTQDADLSNMLRVTSKCGNDKGWMSARSGPLFNNVDFVAW
jgi:hypothetical protein